MIKPEKIKAREILGKDLYEDILEIKDKIQLDKTLFGFFNRCSKVNEVLSKYNFFLKFFERRDKYRFLIQKKVKRKNKVTRDLSSSVTEKFNGYEIIKHKMGHQEKVNFTPTNTVYEPIYDEHTPVSCYFTDQVHLAYRSYIGINVKGSEKITHPTVRQCQYCENFFAKNNEHMKK